eukprot:TRINITY_DN364_c0_g1_i7.p1 TRINITY_DN364_c0_g1~~TRINITY_DN364_c0_g1_i7.p1  ORF type:complete len:552 (+),score=235.01 TRINITY_DN364_c0_g1_i7:184-1656(+)
MIAFGRPYISNPDLPERFAKGAALNPDAEYADWWGIGKGASGYTDFPTMEQADAPTPTRSHTTDASLKLLSTVKVGAVELQNRMALAPLTRGRATEDHLPTEVMVEYYRQRGSAGLVITEAAGISRQGAGWYSAPGIWNQEQVTGWKKVTEAVHARKGVVAMQLWHMGRQAHSDVTGEATVAPSAIAIEGEVTAWRGEKKPYETPKELTVDEIKKVQQDYKNAAVNAKRAGCDMVELHAANGYLLDLFLQSSTNKRTDAYGGSVEKRLRMLSEVLAAVEEVYPASRIGVRLSPNGAFGSMGSADNIDTFSAAVRMLGDRKVGYVHLMDGLGFGFHELTEAFTLKHARELLEQTKGAGGVTKLMGNVGYTRETAEERVQAGEADMIAFGRPYISNPDLPERFAKGAALNPDAEYADWWGIGKGASGYTDFPTMQQADARAQVEKKTKTETRVAVTAPAPTPTHTPRKPPQRKVAAVEKKKGKGLFSFLHCC